MFKILLKNYPSSSASSTKQCFQILKKPVYFNGGLNLNLKHSFSTSSSSSSTPSNSETLSSSQYAKSLFALRISGYLSTVGVTNNKPFGSLIPYATDESFVGARGGHALIGLHEEEQHFQNLKEFDQASLMMYALTPADKVPSKVGVPFVLMQGKVEKIKEQSEIDWAKRTFIARHPQSKSFVDDYRFHWLAPSLIKVGGATIGSSISVDVKEYEQTEPDDIMANSKTVLEKLNRTNRKELLNYCKLVGGDDAKNLVDAFVFNIDQFGFDIMGQQSIKDNIETNTVFRAPFSVAMKSIDETLDIIEFSIKNPTIANSDFD